MIWGDNMKKLLFITWSISYGYGTEKSLADVLNRMDQTKYDINVLPLFKNFSADMAWGKETFVNGTPKNPVNYSIYQLSDGEYTQVY